MIELTAEQAVALARAEQPPLAIDPVWQPLFWNLADVTPEALLQTGRAMAADAGGAAGRGCGTGRV